MVSTIYKWRFQCERQKCEDEELRALLGDGPTQTTLSSTMINLNHEFFEKRPEWVKRHGKVILLHDKHQNWRKTPWNRLDGTSFRPRCYPLIWRNLSSLRINGTRACRAALQQFWRSLKMAHRMVCHKRKTIFLVRYSKCVETDGQSFV